MTIGQKAYNAFWKSLYPDATHFIKWETLNEKTRLAWNTAAQRVKADLDTIMEGYDIHAVRDQAMQQHVNNEMPDVMALIDELYENYK